MLFQGQEILEDEYFRDTDPVDWSKLLQFAGIRDLYADLIVLRRNAAGVTAGLQGQHVNDGGKVLALTH
jgi:1,4-alpha-glucan branching enzyme